MEPKYPWPTAPKEGSVRLYNSFFVAGFPLGPLKHEVVSEAIELSYDVKVEVGVLNGLYGILVTRVR